jgi:uncharacterized protein HemX
MLSSVAHQGRRGMIKTLRVVWAVPTLMVTMAAAERAQAQDVPGIEICTVDKTWERRTSCLQSNVDFLVKTINRLKTDQDQKLDAARRTIEAQNAAIASLQKAVAELQGSKKPDAAAASKDSASKDAPAKDAPVKDTPAKDVAPKDAPAKK